MTVHADPLRVEQALSNLVDNALRHGGGTVLLSAACHNGAVDLHVLDSGPGFPEDFLAIAFERFSRPEEGRTSQGTGLGLSIVRSIARAHGGEAHAENRISGGADAWISLPEVADHAPAPGPPVPTVQRSVA
jgi:two-component system, OmpR family, sensor kinase